jgi:hypothetical protein
MNANLLSPVVLWIIVFAGFLACGSPARATPQMGDVLAVVAGESASAEQHYVHGMTLPEEAEARLKAWKKKAGHTAVSSANWNGYHAQLRLAAGRLYIEALEVDTYKGSPAGSRPRTVSVPLTKVFSEKGPVAAEWFTGELREYHGKAQGYTHVRSHARVFHFQNGRLIKREESVRVKH